MSRSWNRPRSAFVTAGSIAAAAVAAVLLGVSAASAAPGSSGWTVVDSQPSSTMSSYSAMAPAGAASLFAVGSTGSGGSRSSLAKRWDGKHWHVLPRVIAPNGRPVRGLDLVAATSGGNAWASGGQVVAHWFHDRWHTYFVGRNDHVAHIDARSPHDVWFLAAHSVGGGKQVGIAWHWDGTRLRSSRLPIVPNRDESARDWADGYDPSTIGQRIVHLVGARWVVVTGPKVARPAGTDASFFAGVAATPSGAVFVQVGFSKGDGEAAGLSVYRRTATGWSRAFFFARRVPYLLTADRHSGLWLLAPGRYAEFAVHLVRGHIVSSTRTPNRPALQTYWLALRPGSAAIWLAGEAIPRTGPFAEVVQHRA